MGIQIWETSQCQVSGEAAMLGSLSVRQLLPAAAINLGPGSPALSLLCRHPPSHLPPSPLPGSLWLLSCLVALGVFAGGASWGQGSGLSSFQGTLGSLSALP